jgi:hypothetical protein
LKCPPGTESDRGANCLGMCKNSAASKYAVSIVNPVTYVEQITSVEAELSTIEGIGKNDGSSEGGETRRRL